MPINYDRSEHELRFTLWGDVFVHIAVWTQTFDSLVIRELEQESINIAMVYQLQHLGNGCIVSVFSTESQSSSVFHTTHDRIPDELPESYLRFILGQQELDLLQNWEYWNEALAFSSRYIYEFDTSIAGRLGYAIYVTDAQHQTKLDVTIKA